LPLASAIAPQCGHGHRRARWPMNSPYVHSGQPPSPCLGDSSPCPRVGQGARCHGSRDGEPGSGHWMTEGMDPEPEHEGRGGGWPHHEREAAVRKIERLKMRERCEEAARVERLWVGCRKWAVSIQQRLTPKLALIIYYQQRFTIKTAVAESLNKYQQRLYLRIVVDNCFL
jgi:hypothetical protein